MKGSMFKKIIPLLLVFAMTAFIAACGNQTESGGTEKSTSTGTAASKAMETEAIDPLGKYDPGITLTTVRSSTSSMKFPSGDDVTNNAFTRAIKDELGVTVEFKWVVDFTQEKTKIATMLASGDIPDFFFADSATYKKLVESDAVTDMTEIYAKYASDDLKQQDSNFKEGFDSAIVDGKQFGIARLGFGKISLPQILWMRADWLAQSGMPAPKTVSELEAVAKKFMSDHPGSYGIALDKALTNPYDSIIGFSNIYHAYPKHWIKNADGQIVYGSIQGEMKTTLAALQNMYKSGVIHKEFAIKDANKTAEDIAAGKVGILFGVNWMGYYPLADSQKNDPNADWKPFDVPTADDKPILLQGAWPVDGYYVVNKNCKNPEALVKILNWRMKKELAGDFSKEPYAQTDWQAVPCFQTVPNNDYDAAVMVGAALASGDDSKLNTTQRILYNDAKKWKDSKDISGFGQYMQYAPEGAYAIIKRYVDEDRVLLTEMRGSDPEEYAGVKATLEKLEDDAFTKIIMGASLDEFDKYVESWNKLGGEASTKVINDVFNK